MSVLDRLEATIDARKAEGDTSKSHTAQLLAKGRLKCAQKFGEEAVEDPEKPALQIFERKRKARPPRSDKAPAPNQRRGAKPKDDGKAQNRKPKPAGGKPQSGQRRQAEKQPDPNSPFAVLAALKTKG